MVLLSEATWERVKRMFPAEKLVTVEQLLVEECGDTRRSRKDATPESLERIRFAVLKLSGGSVDRLRKAIELRNQDFRDLLVAAGFGDPKAHEKWWPEDLRSGSE